METLKKVFLGIFICLLSFFVMSHNVSAIEITQTPQIIYAGYPFKMTAFGENCYDTQHTCPSFVAGWTNSYSGRFGSNFNGLSLTLPAMTYESDWLVYQFNVNNSRSTSANHSSFLGLTRDTSNASINFDVVSYEFEQLTDNDSLLTVYIKMIGEQVVTNSQNLNGLRMVGASGSWLQLQAPANAVNGVGITTMSLNVFRDIPGQDYSTSINAINDKLGTTNNKLEDINNTLEEQQQQEQDAYDNISNQSPDDLSGDTDNQASTNLIGLFQSFITALSNITQADNCNLSLAFPSYAGGTVNVNVCQYKDKGGNIVAIFSSLTLIVFYIPLALKLLSIIYNEIRSFTNG